MFEDLIYHNKLPPKSMEDPFFRNYFPPPQHRSPLNFTTRKPPSPQPWPPKQKQRKKVVSIPVHHVVSTKNRSESAKKIQKIFRGFRVRKTVKKILELKKEVDDMEKKLLEGDALMAVIRKNKLERLKVSETLMALLLKLDSVKGIDCGVREFRKLVITKAIMLQEIVDAAIDDDDVEKKKEIVGECCKNLEISGGNDDCIEKLTENLNDLSKISTGETLGKDAHKKSDDLSKMQFENSSSDKKNCNETLEKCEGIVVDEEDDDTHCNDMQVEFVADNAESWECVEDESEEQSSDFVEIPEGGGNNMEEEKEKEKKEKLLEKMAEDNQRLIAMVADLCQKNATQTRWICSLSQRVEQLEKSMSDRMRKKKKKNKNKKCNASLT